VLFILQVNEYLLNRTALNLGIFIITITTWSLTSQTWSMVITS